MSAPVSQPSMDCGPPMEAINSGMVMNGPIPTMLDMLRAVAWSKPKARVRWGSDSVFIAIGRQVGALRFRPLLQLRESTDSVFVCQSDCLFLIDCVRESALFSIQIVPCRNTIAELLDRQVRQH